MVYVLGPRDRKRIAELKDSGVPVVNTTSSARGMWSSGLSPFLLGPVGLYGGRTSRNVENAWQYSKCYACHVSEDGNPSAEYFKWAEAGWAKDRADRYPMGKGAKPEYSWWDGEKLDYVSARKRIYLPLYAKAVAMTPAYSRLKEMNNAGDLVLWDFDAYDHHALGVSYEDVLNDPKRKMGHGFVLGMMLERKDLVVDCLIEIVRK